MTNSNSLHSFHCSYSRQNLLSSASCKSNEDVCHGISATSQNRDVYQQQPSASVSYSGRNNAIPVQVTTHNNLPALGSNKYLFQLRNQINPLPQAHQPPSQQQQQQPIPPPQQQQQQQQQSIVTPDVLNVNQHYPQHDIELVTSNTNYNNLNITTVVPSASPMSMSPAGAYGELAAGGQHHLQNNHHFMNINNFDLNDLKLPKTTTKMLQKPTTGGNKRDRHERDQNNLDGSVNGGFQQQHDLNLASTVAARQGSKSSSKLFDDLKENVYLEVSALIAANESRPHFLINLFRELQLISASDPLRKRLMQAFQGLCQLGPEPVNGGDDFLERNRSGSLPSSDNRTNPSPESTEENPAPSGVSNPRDSVLNQNNTQLSFQCPADSHASLITSIMQDIRDFLGHEPIEISDPMLQVISTIVSRHLNATGDVIAHDELLRTFTTYDKCSNEKFLESLEIHLDSLLGATGDSRNIEDSNQPAEAETEEATFDRRIECNFLDSTAKPQSIPCKSNKVLSVLRKRDKVVLSSSSAGPSNGSSNGTSNGTSDGSSDGSSNLALPLADVVAVSHVLPQPQVTSPPSPDLVMMMRIEDADAAEPF